MNIKLQHLGSRSSAYFKQGSQASTHKDTGMAFDYNMQSQVAKRLYPEKETNKYNLVHLVNCKMELVKPLL